MVPILSLPSTSTSARSIPMVHSRSKHDCIMGVTSCHSDYPLTSFYFYCLFYALLFLSLIISPEDACLEILFHFENTYTRRFLVFLVSLKIKGISLCIRNIIKTYLKMSGVTSKYRHYTNTHTIN